VENSYHRGHPLIAAVYDRLLASFQRRVRPYRRALLSHAAGHLVEIGAGTGANFEFYAEARNLLHPVVATEPDRYMRMRAAARARETGTRIQLVAARAEQLPFAAETFDTVVGTFVMCTVADPSAALAEVKRVLKPGGIYLFMEHVRSKEAWTKFVQDVATPVWKLVAGGCHINRDTVSLIENQGLELVELMDPGVGSTLLPLVIGAARQGGVASDVTQ